MSSFFICIMATMARPAFALSLLVINCRIFVGVTCQDRPNLSFSHPHGPSSPPPAVSADQ